MEDKLKFKDSVIFKENKEEITNNKERYKPVLLELLEENRINSNIYMSIIKLWEKGWNEEAHIYIDKLKFDKCTFKNCKEEIIKNKDRYKPALLKVLEENKVNSNIKKEILEIWEKEWKEEANLEIDKLKFEATDIFKEYKKEIKKIKNKERYKPVLLGLLEKDKINEGIYREIIDIWEKEWKEEANLEIDKLKFEWDIFEKYKEEIGKNKDRYKPALLELLEEKKIKCCIEEIIDIWEKEWKEESNIKIDKLKFNKWRLKYYKEEIGKNKERYKLVLLEVLEKDKIDDEIYKEIIDIWEEYWKEEHNIKIDKFKFCNEHLARLFEKYKEEISNDKERYKPALLELLEKNEISYRIYGEIIEIWEEEWKEEPNIYIDKLKFEANDIFKEYKEEIKKIKNKDRYKAVLLGLLKKKKIDNEIYKQIINIWEKDWGEEPIIELNKRTINIDELKFKDSETFREYKEEISKDKERYKPVLLGLLEEDKIDEDIYKEIIEIWEEKWKEVPNIDIDKLKFYCYDEINLFKEYKDEIEKNKERYKPVVLELKKEDRWIDKEIIDIWKKDWKEEGEIEGNPKLINIDRADYFVENRDEIIKDKEKYEVTVRRVLSPITYKKIKPILNSWGESDIELLIKLILKSTYKLYNILYGELKDELIENRDSIIEYINKNYKVELKDKTIKLFILTTIQTIDELENKLKLLKVKDMNKLIEYLIKLNLDKDIDSEVLKNIIKIVTDKISEVEYIKLLMGTKKSKDKLPVNYMEILENIFNSVESKEEFDSLVKNIGFDTSIELLKYIKENIIQPDLTKGYIKVLEKYYPNEFSEFKEKLGESLLDKFDGLSYSKYIEYNRYIDILDNVFNYEDLMKFKVAIGINKYFKKSKISEVDIEYSDKERIKIAYWGKYKNVKKLSKVDEYVEDILPKNKKYINYEIDDLGFNDKKERYFRYDNDNIVVKLKDRKLHIFNSSGKEIKRLSSTSEDFYTVRTLENIKELKEMVKNVYTDSDKGIKKEYCNDVLRDYDLWREIYIDNILLQEYATNLIWEEVDYNDNIVGRFRYVQDGEFCDSNDDEYIINKENRVRLLSLDKVSNDEIKRWREQFDDYEIVQPIEQLDLYNIDYSDIELSNKEIELGKLEKNLTLRFKYEEMYFEIENILKIELEEEINWVKYKKLSKDTIVKISKIEPFKNRDYNLRMLKVLKDKLGI